VDEGPVGATLEEWTAHAAMDRDHPNAGLVGDQRRLALPSATVGIE
jgi:hypothetical protein